ncbi:MAG TPA: hypothetical protein VFQ61_38935 [Polyangiaceae bacterium]|nr:hypothetical protein [Polyangiaceae bacterium]
MTPPAAPATSSDRSAEAVDSGASDGSGSVSAAPDELPPVSTDWCTAPVQVLDQDTCYVLPEDEQGVVQPGTTSKRAQVRELLIYLHGVVPPGRVSPQKTHFQEVVANAARRARIAALIPRGKRGLAPKGFAGWWGWPTSAEAYKREGAQLAAAFEAKQRMLESITGQPFERRYLGGSSAGAYFVTLLMADGAFPAQGYMALAGGAIPPGRNLRADPASVYVGYGKFDPVGSSSRALADFLSRAGWPVRVAVHPVPHGASEVYLDEAFAFFRSSGN